MKSTGLIRRIGGAALMLAMMIGINIATTQSVHAQWRNDDRSRNDNAVRWPIQRTRQYAQLLGYHNAYSEGKEAVTNGFRGSYRDMPGYRNSINGWLAWMGDANAYRDSYRRGYAEGFRDGQSGRNRRFRRADVERVLGDRMKDVYGGNDDDYDDDRWRRGRGRDDDGWGRGDRGRDDGGWGRGDRGRYDRNEVLRIAQQNGYREGARHGQEDRSRRRGYDYDDAREYRDATSGYRSEYGDRGVYQQGFREGYRRGYDDSYRGRSTSGPRLPFPWPF